MYNELAIFALFVFCYTLIAGRLERAPASGPIVFVAAGFLMGPLVLGWFDGSVSRTELRMLDVLNQLAQEGPWEIVPTYLGAHAIPPEYKNDPQGYTDHICQVMLPALEVWWQNNAPTHPKPFVDVFCETGAFDLAQSRRVLEAARGLGFPLKIHADEFDNLGGASLAAGLVCDTWGTGLMFDMAGGMTFDLHGISGLLAILLMFIHAAWALIVLLKKDEKALLNFHKFSLAVWVIWLVPYFSPMFFALGS